MTAGRVTSSLHTAAVGAGQLRFFRSPSPGPDLPWHIHDDLMRCLGLPRSLRRELRRALANGPFRADARAIGTPGGIETTAPHYAAMGLLGAAAEMGHPGVAEVERGYVEAATVAMGKLTSDLPPAARVEYALQAARHNHLGQGDGGGA